MSTLSPETYLQSIIRELESAYDHYCLTLSSFRDHRKTWKSRSIENFLTVEKASLLRIKSREKVLSRWLLDYPGLTLVLPKGLSQLEWWRSRSIREKELLMKETRSAMNSLKQEQKSLRIPRGKPIRKESVPTLIDIKL